MDEIVINLEDRYISVTEACHLLFAFEANLPHVMRLILYLENKQTVVFRKTSDLEEEVLNGQKHSTLTGLSIAKEKLHQFTLHTYRTKELQKRKYTCTNCAINCI